MRLKSWSPLAFGLVLTIVALRVPKLVYRSAPGGLKVAITRPWGSIYPGSDQLTVATALVSRLVFPCLINDGGTGLYWSAISSKWAFAPDGKSVEFLLDDGRRFEDGSPVRAKDIKSAWEKLLLKKLDSSQGRGDLEEVARDVLGAREFLSKKYRYLAGFKSIGEQTLRVEFSRPLRKIPDFLTECRLPVFKFDKSDGFIGAGDYRLISSQEKLVKLERKSEEEKDGFPWIEFHLHTQASAKVAFDEGVVDIISLADGSMWRPGSYDRGKAVVVTGLPSRRLVAVFNSRSGRVLSKLAFRRVLEAIFDDALSLPELPPALSKPFFLRDRQFFVEFSPGRLSNSGKPVLVKRDLERLIERTRIKPLVVSSYVPGADWLIAKLAGWGVRVHQRKDWDVGRVRAAFKSGENADLLIVYAGYPGVEISAVRPLVDPAGVLFSRMLGEGSPFGRALGLIDRGIANGDTNSASQALASDLLKQARIIQLGLVAEATVFNPRKVQFLQKSMDRDDLGVYQFAPAE